MPRPTTSATFRSMFYRRPLSNPKAFRWIRYRAQPSRRRQSSPPCPTPSSRRALRPKDLPGFRRFRIRAAHDGGHLHWRSVRQVESGQHRGRALRLPGRHRAADRGRDCRRNQHQERRGNLVFDTPGFFEPAVERMPHDIVERQSLLVDTVTGATLTAAAIAACAKVLEQAGATMAGFAKATPASRTRRRTMPTFASSAPVPDRRPRSRPSKKDSRSSSWKRPRASGEGSCATGAPAVGSKLDEAGQPRDGGRGVHVHDGLLLLAHRREPHVQRVVPLRRDDRLAARPLGANRPEGLLGAEGHQRHEHRARLREGSREVPGALGHVHHRRGHPAHEHESRGAHRRGRRRRRRESHQAGRHCRDRACSQRSRMHRGFGGKTPACSARYWGRPTFT